MPGDEPLTRAELLSRAGVENDVLSFWLKRDVIRALPRVGEGKHRRFAYVEVNIAAVLNQLRDFGVNIDGLRSVSLAFREALSWAERWNIKNTDEVCAIGAAKTLRANLESKKKGLEAYIESFEEALAYELEHARHDKHEGQRLTPEIEAIADKMSSAEFYHFRDLYITIRERPTGKGEPPSWPGYVTVFWRAGDRWQVGYGPDAFHFARSDGALTTLAIDVSILLHRVWKQA
jgi:DNA-binding transcriptional MerR regulator